MNLRPFTFVVTLVSPVVGLAQLSIFDATYRIEALARSGSAVDSQTSFSNGTGPVQSFFDRVDANAATLPSTVHSWASVMWNCTPTDLDAELIACWDSVDFGAGNSARMLSRLNLGIDLSTTSVVSTIAGFDAPNSFLEIDAWNGSTWVLLVNRVQIQSYSAIWGPGQYRLRGQRLYNPVGSSTGCAPFNFHLTAVPVPEPAGSAALALGGLVLLRRRARG